MRRIPTAVVLTATLLLAPAPPAAAYAHTEHLDMWAGGLCQVCGADYACANQYEVVQGSFAFHVPFIDPLPADSLLTQVTVNTWGLNAAAAATWLFQLNGELVAMGADPHPETIDCADCQGPTPYASITYPGGFPGYVYGGPNSFDLQPTATTYCLAYIELEMTYVDDPGDDDDTGDDDTADDDTGDDDTADDDTGDDDTGDDDTADDDTGDDDAGDDDDTSDDDGTGDDDDAGDDDTGNSQVGVLCSCRHATAGRSAAGGGLALAPGVVLLMAARRGRLLSLMARCTARRSCSSSR